MHPPIDPCTAAVELAAGRRKDGSPVESADLDLDLDLDLHLDLDRIDAYCDRAGDDVRKAESAAADARRPPAPGGPFLGMDIPLGRPPPRSRQPLMRTTPLGQRRAEHRRAPPHRGESRRRAVR
jgi:hypothetical protein